MHLTASDVPTQALLDHPDPALGVPCHLSCRLPPRCAEGGFIKWVG